MKRFSLKEWPGRDKAVSAEATQAGINGRQSDVSCEHTRRGGRMAGLRRACFAAAAVLLLSTGLSALQAVPARAAGKDTSYTGVIGDVSKDARAKYTKLKGNGKDSVTIMIYMIGTDLESQNGMATSDLNEMLYSELDNSKVNLYIQSGGCKRWRNSVMTAGKLQRWKLTGEGIALQDTMKSQAMTQGSVLSDFIQYCAKESPADRYMLIFWDHGGGSVSGYGYDEVYPNDTMDVSEISRALEYGGVQFDFIGFDACLMATLETAIAIEPYADYMIASEESEPGTGWYYTNWLKLLDKNSSTNTLNLGRQIIDDFTMASARANARSQTTLSIVDLAELKGTVISKLGSFGQELVSNLKGNNYQSVASARNGTREFSQNNRLDQVDLVDFCNRLGTTEAKKLSSAIQNAVKYNKVSQITNAYGLSIYFPNASLRSVNSMLKIYENIGMDSDWSESVRAYATLESSGQIAASSGAAYGGSSGSLIDILLGSLGGDSSSGSAYSSSSLFGGTSYDSYGSMSEQDLYNMITGGSSFFSGGSSSGQGSSSGHGGSSSSHGSSSSSDEEGTFAQMMNQLSGGYTTTSGESYGGLDFFSMLGGYDANDYSQSSGYDSYSSDSMTGDLLSLAAQLLFRNAPLGAETLGLTEKDGEQVMILPEERWEQVTAVELNVFVDDGEGFLDLGLDNVAEYNDDGDLIDTWDGTWLTLEGQPVAVYPISDEDDDENGLYITRKFIPALLNGERVNLIVEFNEETGEDKVLGAQSVTGTGVVGKGYTEMNPGDVITLVCDFYNYDGLFSAQYTLGEPVTVPEDCQLTIANMEISGGERMLYTYRLTDMYQAHYWLPTTVVE